MSPWGLIVFLATLAVLFLGRINAPYRHLSPDLITRAWPFILLGGFLGAHLYYLLVVSGWPFRPLPTRDVLNIFQGTAVQGGILGGAAAAILFTQRQGLPFLPFADVLSPAGALAQAITRVGCFVAGCCYGRPTNLFGSRLPLHPAQLYEAFLDAGLAVYLQKRLKAERDPGKVFALYIMGACLIRFVVQFFRDDDRGHLLWGLAHSQFLSILLFLAAAVLYHRVNKEVVL